MARFKYTTRKYLRRSISGSKARILRWDRSGVLVTEVFDHKADPQILIDFVWRFVWAKDHQRGFDPTAVTVNSKEDRDLFWKAISSHIQLQLGLDPKTDEKELLNEVCRHYYPGAIARLTIGGSDVWVSRPLHRGLLGCPLWYERSCLCEGRLAH